MRRILAIPRPLRFGLLLVASWCVMTTTHESGHLVCGWATGGRLHHADLAPWRLPHSGFDPDPVPLLTVWGGPVLGVLVPVGVAALVRRRWAWLGAHFCLLANGSYLAVAWVTGEPQSDTAKLFRHGAHPAAVAAFCVVTIGVGYAGFRRGCVRAIAPTAASAAGQAASEGTT